MNLGAWLKNHKPEAALGVGGIVVTIALYERKKSQSAGGGTAAPATTSSYAYPPAVADTTGTDLYNGLESQIQGLQWGLASLQAPPAAPAGSAGAPAASSTAPYTAISSPAELQSFFDAGGTPYVNIGGEWFPYQASPELQPPGGYQGILNGTVYAGPPLPNQGQKTA